MEDPHFSQHAAENYRISSSPKMFRGWNPWNLGKFILQFLSVPTNVGFLEAMLAIFTNAWDFGDGNSTKAPALRLQKGSEKGWMYKDGVKFATFHSMKVILYWTSSQKIQETSCFFFKRASYCKQISKWGSYLCLFTLHYMLSEHFNIKVQTLLGKTGLNATEPTIGSFAIIQRPSKHGTCQSGVGLLRSNLNMFWFRTPQIWHAFCVRGQHQLSLKCTWKTSFEVKGWKNPSSCLKWTH